MWTLEDDFATLVHGPMSLKVSLRDPSLGLADLKLESVAVPRQRWLGLEDSRQVPLALVDCFLRRTELVGRYACDSASRLSLDTSWRQLVHGERAFGMELLVALESGEPHDHMVIHAVNRFRADERLVMSRPPGRWSDAEPAADRSFCAVLCRNDDVKWSYLEMLHPGDQDQAHWDLIESEPSLAGWTSCLCHGPLEKGVIRRSRLQFWFLERESDEDLARELCGLFNDAALPLGR